MSDSGSVVRRSHFTQHLFRLALFAAVALTFWTDYVTGPDIGFSLLYLIPIAIAARFFGLKTAFGVAAAASCAWFAAEMLWDPPSIAVTVWNATTRVVIYFSLAYLVVRVTRSEQELRKLLLFEQLLARTDATTQLSNSRSFVEKLGQSVRSERREDGSLALLYLDLDNFKKVNDNFGHSAGDDVLQRVGSALQSITRDFDHTARLGGDEFGVLLRAVAKKESVVVAERILAAIKKIANDYAGTQLSASIGVALCEADVCDAEKLLKVADAAMYDAKLAGKERVAVRSCDH